ncbi:MAG: hypothetical protein EON59_03395 [Alphaproteobacteria bacterium]|nr:MAG: hypothetical protein EON59_03395 [Alphaproteobacteria bacterium]
MKPSDADAPFAPLVVSDRSDITSALIKRRHSIGWKGEDIDERAGWADRLIGKLESPGSLSARRGFVFDWPSEVLPTGSVRATGMGAVWLKALGLSLVLVDRATADRIGAVETQASVSDAEAKCGRRQVQDARRKRTGVIPPMSASAFECTDRTLMLRETLQASLMRHPWMAAHPVLQERAQAIDAALEELRLEIMHAPE